MASQATSPAASPAPNPGSQAAAPALADPSALPQGIEIFRAGTHRDDAGNTHHFTRAQLAEMAASYNAELREAPLTVGHPKDNLPAYGWVAKVYVNEAGNLAIDPHQVDPQFAQMVKDGRFKKRSASFYPPTAPHNPTPGKWYLRHVAFLGAQPPAVAGLKDIGFADAGEAVSFSETAAPSPAPADPTQPQEHAMSDPTKDAEVQKLRDELKAANDATAKAQAEAKDAADKVAAAQKEVQSFSEKAAADRRAGFASFAESQVKAGRLLPKDKAVAIAALEAVSAAQPVSFSEGGTTTTVTALELGSWLQGQISSRNPVVSFGEQAGGGADVSQFDARGKTDAEVHRAALAYQAQHPEVNYAEALSQVVSFSG